MDFSDILLMYVPHLLEVDGTQEHVQVMNILKPVLTWINSEFKAGTEFHVPECVQYPVDDKVPWCTNCTLTLTASMGLDVD